MKKITAFFIMIVLLLSLPVMAEDVSDTRRVVLTNCDTGRCVYTEQYNQFVCHDYGNGSCSFTNERSSAFLDFTEEGMEYSYSEVRYTLIDTGFSRYQIMTEDGRLVIDTDEGETNEASVGLAPAGSKAVNTAWYITENADDVIKVMPLGDSLTWGSNPDVMGPNLSYRCELSDFLVDYFGDVVFTGNETTDGFYCDTKALMRHSGYCGYVIEDVYHVSDHPGLSEMITPMMEKYSPDIVVMMLGTNDCAMVSGSSEINALMDRWESFVRNIEGKLPENGTVICCTIPPCPNFPNRVTKFNELLKERASALKEEGLKVEVSDVYGALEGGEDVYLCSDNVHLTDAGNDVTAERICRTIASLYGRDGVKGNGMNIEFEEESVEESESESESASESVTESEPEPIEEEKEMNPLIFLAAGIGVLMAALIVVLIILKNRK